MMLALRDKFKLIGFAVGIFISYTLKGVATEKLFKSEYNGEKFTFSFTLVAAECIVYTIVAIVLSISRENPKHETSQKYYILISVFYVTGMVTANMALNYVSYPVQVIGKACKPIPVMIFGFLIARKSYTIQKIFFVLMIVLGVGVFIYKTDEANKSSDAYSNWGNILIGISLLTDGIMGSIQELMRKSSRPSAINFMLYLNAWSSLFLSIIVIVKNEGIELLQFIHHHHEVLIYLSCVLITGSFGQIFIASMVTNFGALPLATVTTLRKFFTILLSCFLFKNLLSVQQWIGTGIIFSAISADVILRERFSENISKEVITENHEIDVKRVKENSSEMKQKENKIEI